MHADDTLVCFGEVEGRAGSWVSKVCAEDFMGVQSVADQWNDPHIKKWILSIPNEGQWWDPINSCQ